MRDDPAIAMALERLLLAAQPPDGDPTGTYTVPAHGSDRPTYTVAITAESTADDSSQATASRVSYCLDCEWSVSSANYSAQEMNVRIIEHAVETGHEIESDDTAGPVAPGQTTHSRSADDPLQQCTSSEDDPAEGGFR